MKPKEKVQIDKIICLQTSTFSEKNLLGKFLNVIDFIQNRYLKMMKWIVHWKYLFSPAYYAAVIYPWLFQRKIAQAVWN